MPTASFTKSYDDTTILTESQLDDLKNSIESFLNTTKIDSDNIQDLGIVAAKLASDSVETSKIKDSNVTTAKIATDAVETAKIKDSNVTTAKLADDETTWIKRKIRAVTTNGTDPGLGGVSQSASTGAAAVIGAAGSELEITTILTVGGGPVWIGAVHDGTTNSSYFYMDNTVHFAKFYYDATQISTSQIGEGTVITWAPPRIHQIVIPNIAAGTYTFKLQLYKIAGTHTADYIRLCAYEL